MQLSKLYFPLEKNSITKYSDIFLEPANASTLLKQGVYIPGTPEEAGHISDECSHGAHLPDQYCEMKVLFRLLTEFKVVYLATSVLGKPGALHRYFCLFNADNDLLFRLPYRHPPDLCRAQGNSCQPHKPATNFSRNRPAKWKKLRRHLSPVVSRSTSSPRSLATRLFTTMFNLNCWWRTITQTLQMSSLSSFELVSSLVSSSHCPSSTSLPAERLSSLPGYHNGLNSRS